MKDIIVLNIKFNFGGTEDVIHPVILKDNNERILVDCGCTGFMHAIEASIKAEGLDCSQLTKILITHHDHDHMGEVADFKAKYSHIQIFASEIEAPYISGEKKSICLEQAEAFQSTLSGEQRKFGEAFCNILKNVRSAKVDMIVHGGEVLNWCGGCEIISTSGHTPGHISLCVKDKETIITGDAATLEGNQLVIANPQFTLDLENAGKDISKLLSYDAVTYICYHGGIYKKAEK